VTPEPAVEEAEAPTPEPEPAIETPPTERVLENVEPIMPEDTVEAEPAGGSSTASPPSASPPAGSTVYGVQVASVSAEREEHARRALADAERVVNEKGQLIASNDGTLLRLVMGSFQDRAQATQLMERMRQHSQFEGCFVQTFTQP